MYERKWSQESIEQEAAKYGTFCEWRKKSPSSYVTASRLGMLKSFVDKLKRQRNKWTKENVLLDALLYTSKTEWRKNSTAYQIAHKNGWMKEACLHMKKASAHNKLWFKESILKEAKKFSSKKEWRLKSMSSYQAAQRLGLLDMASAHMELLNRPRWEKEQLLMDAKGFNSRSEWKRKSSGAYKAALNMGILDEACSHMKKTQKRWTKKQIFEDAKKFTDKVSWKQSSSGYKAAQRMGLLDEASAHMEKVGGVSYPEKNLMSIILEKYPKAQSSWFKVKDPGFSPATRFQLDIYIPELRKGIEFNGEYWHSREGLKRGRPNWKDDDINNYHELKKRFFEFKKIKVFEVWEKDWKNNKDQVLERLMKFLE
jgi:hypothetical protein